MEGRNEFGTRLARLESQFDALEKHLTNGFDDIKRAVDDLSRPKTGTTLQVLALCGGSVLALVSMIGGWITLNEAHNKQMHELFRAQIVGMEADIDSMRLNRVSARDPEQDSRIDRLDEDIRRLFDVVFDSAESVGKDGNP